MPRRGANSHTREQKLVSPHGVNIIGRWAFHDIGARSEKATGRRRGAGSLFHSTFSTPFRI